MLTCYIFYNLLFYWLLPVSKRVSSLVNLHLTQNRTKYSGSLPNLGFKSCFILRFCVLPVYPKIVQNCKFSSGKFSILTKFWISFKLHLIDTKSHGDHEYLVFWSAAQWLRRYRLLPVYFRKICIKLASELCSLYSSKD